MMKKHTLGILALACLIVCGCEKSKLGHEYPSSFIVSVKNNSAFARTDQALTLSVSQIREQASDFNPKAFVVLDSKKELASQADDLNGDGAPDQITFVADFAPNEEKVLTIGYAKNGEVTGAYPKRTQAELSHKFGGKFENRKYVGGEFRNVAFVKVPPEHTDHSLFFRYEGPGWESDKVGYRFYLDWRNATDIWGKRIPDMVLQNVGQDGMDSYHEMADWGMDLLKVGESLGIGAIGMYHDGKVFRVSETDSITCSIVANGPVYSQVRTTYSGWKIGDEKFHLVSDFSITAGSRLTKHSLTISPTLENLCTGLVKHENAVLLQSEMNGGEWTYLALYGKQSLAEDNLGMAILYNTDDRIEMTEDEFSELVLLKPQNGKLIYYFLAAWEQEPNGIKTKEEFLVYLNEMISVLNSPIAVKMD